MKEEKCPYCGERFSRSEYEELMDNQDDFIEYQFVCSSCLKEFCAVYDVSLHDILDIEGNEIDLGAK